MESLASELKQGRAESAEVEGEPVGVSDATTHGGQPYFLLGTEGYEVLGKFIDSNNPIGGEENLNPGR